MDPQPGRPPMKTAALTVLFLLVGAVWISATPPAARNVSKRGAAFLSGRTALTMAPTTMPTVTTKRPTPAPTKPPTAVPTAHEDHPDILSKRMKCLDEAGTNGHGVYIDYKTLRNTKGVDASYLDKTKNNIYCWCNKSEGYTHCEGPLCVYNVDYGTESARRNQTGFPASCGSACKCGRLTFEAADKKLDREQYYTQQCKQREHVGGVNFFSRDSNAPISADDPKAVAYCKCEGGGRVPRRYDAVGPGSLTYDFGIWGVMKNWGLFPASCASCKCAPHTSGR